MLLLVVDYNRWISVQCTVYTFDAAAGDQQQQKVLDCTDSSISNVWSKQGIDVGDKIFGQSSKCIRRANSEDRSLCLEVVCDGGDNNDEEDDVGKVVFYCSGWELIRCLYNEEVLRLPNSDIEIRRRCTKAIKHIQLADK
jgi:hypothetical protein